MVRGSTGGEKGHDQRVGQRESPYSSSDDSAVACSALFQKPYVETLLLDHR
jgi:hypothetical protein